MDVAISIRGVTKTYAHGEAAVRALDGVDLDAWRGELMLIMGPSGSGKTTLLSVMGCILRPSSGTIGLLGRDVTGLSERELPRLRLEHIGFVFQGFNLFPTLTAAANVALALDLKRVPRREAMRRALALPGTVWPFQQARRVPRGSQWRPEAAGGHCTCDCV
jgi:putative ABC transport system ATP-binding protein